MTRLDFHAACAIASDCANASVADLNAAMHHLRSERELADIGISRIERELKQRIHARHAREMVDYIATPEDFALEDDGA